MSDQQNPILAVELTVPQLYAVLGHAWFQSAGEGGIVQEAHARLADAAKRALLEAGQPRAIVNDLLGQLLNAWLAEPEPPAPPAPLETGPEGEERPADGPDTTTATTETTTDQNTPA